MGRGLIVFVHVDGALVPEPVQKVFDRVRNNADFMPTWQMEVCAIIVCYMVMVVNATCYCHSVC